MTVTVTNRGKFYLANNAISSSTDFRTAVFKGTAPAAGTIQDLNFLSELEAVSGVDEAAATNYARQDLASVAIAEDDSGNKASITATAPTINSVGAGETWTMAAHYIEGASDAARTLIAVDVPTSSLVTNGSNVTLPQLNLELT